MLADSTDLAFDLVSDMTIHPAFRAEEIERQRQQMLSGLKVSLGDPAYVADTAFQNLIFAGTPYGHSEDGTETSAQRLTAADLRAFHRAYYQPSNAILAVVGDISPSQAMTLAAKYFSAWENGVKPPAVSAAEPTPGSGRRVVAIDKDDAVQTEIRIGALGVPRNSPTILRSPLRMRSSAGPRRIASSRRCARARG